MTYSRTTATLAVVNNAVSPIEHATTDIGKFEAPGSHLRHAKDTTRPKFVPRKLSELEAVSVVPFAASPKTFLPVASVYLYTRLSSGSTGEHGQEITFDITSEQSEAIAISLLRIQMPAVEPLTLTIPKQGGTFVGFPLDSKQCHYDIVNTSGVVIVQGVSDPDVAINKTQVTYSNYLRYVDRAAEAAVSDYKFVTNSQVQVEVTQREMLADNDFMVADPRQREKELELSGGHRIHTVEHVTKPQYLARTSRVSSTTPHPDSVAKSTQSAAWGPAKDYDPLKLKGLENKFIYNMQPQYSDILSLSATPAKSTHFTHCGAEASQVYLQKVEKMYSGSALELPVLPPTTLILPLTLPWGSNNEHLLTTVWGDGNTVKRDLTITLSPLSQLIVERPSLYIRRTAYGLPAHLTEQLSGAVFTSQANLPAGAPYADTKVYTSKLGFVFAHHTLKTTPPVTVPPTPVESLFYKSTRDDGWGKVDWEPLTSSGTSDGGDRDITTYVMPLTNGVESVSVRLTVSHKPNNDAHFTFESDTVVPDVVTSTELHQYAGLPIGVKPASCELINRHVYTTSSISDALSKIEYVRLAKQYKTHESTTTTEEPLTSVTRARFSIRHVEIRATPVYNYTLPVWVNGVLQRGNPFFHRDWWVPRWIERAQSYDEDGFPVYTKVEYPTVVAASFEGSSTDLMSARDIIELNTMQGYENPESMSVGVGGPFLTLSTNPGNDTHVGGTIPASRLSDITLRSNVVGVSAANPVLLSAIFCQNNLWKESKKEGTGYAFSN
jgi:hypothetical protein